MNKYFNFRKELKIMKTLKTFYMNWKNLNPNPLIQKMNYYLLPETNVKESKKIRKKLQKYFLIMKMMKVKVKMKVKMRTKMKNSDIKKIKKTMIVKQFLNNY